MRAGQASQASLWAWIHWPHLLLPDWRRFSGEDPWISIFWPQLLLFDWRNQFLPDFPEIFLNLELLFVRSIQIPRSHLSGNGIGYSANPQSLISRRACRRWRPFLKATDESRAACSLLLHVGPKREHRSMGSLSGSGYNNPAPLGLRMPAFHQQQRLGFRGLHSARGHDDGRGHGCRCGLSTLSALVVLTPHLALPKTKISLCRSSVLRTCFAGTCFAGTCSAGTCFAVTCFADLPGLLCR